MQTMKLMKVVVDGKEFFVSLRCGSRRDITVVLSHPLAASMELEDRLQFLGTHARRH
ncbi:hypothetical protein BH10CYA1_BH10CYA1_48300 [soil metagenome]